MLDSDSTRKIVYAHKSYLDILS